MSKWCAGLKQVFIAMSYSAVLIYKYLGPCPLVMILSVSSWLLSFIKSWDASHYGGFCWEVSHLECQRHFLSYKPLFSDIPVISDRKQHRVQNSLSSCAWTRDTKGMNFGSLLSTSSLHKSTLGFLVVFISLFICYFFHCSLHLNFFSNSFGNLGPSSFDGEEPSVLVSPSV